MRILHLEASTGWGGQEMRILREAMGLRARGHDVYLGVMKGGTLAQRARACGLVVYELDFRKRYWFGCCGSLLRICRRHHIDIIHTHSSLDSWIGGIAARLSGRKSVRTRHFCNAGRSGWNSRLLYGMLTDYVITVTRDLIPVLAKQSGKPIDRFCWLPTGVDAAKIDQKQTAESFRDIWKIDAQTVLVGSVCVMRSWKGIDTFLRAAHLLRHEADLRWVLIGGGHQEPYQALARELGLGERVFFTGHLENPYPAMQALDIFSLLSTAHEGVSQASLQAAYLRKPLITTGVGGLKEVCVQGHTGFCVPPHDFQAVAQAVLQLKQSPALRQLYGQRAHHLVHQQFMFDRTLDGTEAVYAQL